ncbi:hypothetical protein N657DRAFT_408684 [Parathielavia appendiculata]|uniref:Uncharacterized protein n=1 Tax=Parathielavia appendiculata TaxID=2587402 RepID=A0AAN6U014_9PEZI|nr:hypothetical protein N657DRAFT_408684 [Parathielavia appendiculata]
MAGSWSGYLIAFTAWRVDTQAVFFGLRRDAAMHPQPGRDRGKRHHFPFSSFPFFLGRIPEGTRLGRLVRTIAPSACLRDTSRPVLLFPFYPVLISWMMFTAVTMDIPRPNCDGIFDGTGGLAQLDVGRRRRRLPKGTATNNLRGSGIIRDEEMRHDSLGLVLNDAMKGGSSTQGRYKNIHLASQVHSWDIAAEADTGCRQEQGSAFGLGLKCHDGAEAGDSEGGMERYPETGSAAELTQATGLPVCSSFPPELFRRPPSPPRSSQSRPGLGTGLLLRQVTIRTSQHSTFTC